VPLVLLSGGWTIYQRATTALLTDFFGASYSVFGARAGWTMVATNVNLALVSGLVACIPLLAWSRGEGAWRRVFWGTVAINVLFYATFYCAESGYLIGVASLACLTPAAWPVLLRRALRLRIGMAIATGPLFFFLAPAYVPSVTSAGLELPSFSHAVAADSFQGAFRRLVCEAAGGQASLALSNHPRLAPHRSVPLLCPNVIFATWFGGLKFNPQVDSLIVASDQGQVALPTGIPLESGSGVDHRLARPVERIMVAPDASRGFIEMIARQASCPRLWEAERTLGEDRVLVWPARCFSRLQIGKNALLLTPRKEASP